MATGRLGYSENGFTSAFGRHLKPKSHEEAAGQSPWQSGHHLLHQLEGADGARDEAQAHEPGAAAQTMARHLEGRLLEAANGSLKLL